MYIHTKLTKNILKLAALASCLSATAFASTVVDFETTNPIKF